MDITNEDPFHSFLTTRTCMDLDDEIFFDAKETSDETNTIHTTGEPNTSHKDGKGSTGRESIASKLFAATAWFTMTSAKGTNAATTPEHMNILPPEPYFFDAEDLVMPPKPGKVMHLSIDPQIVGNRVKNNHSKFISKTKVNAFLSDLNYNQLVGKYETFDTLICALTAIEKLQQIEALRPRLAWKPIDVIKKTLENTTQWGK